MILSFSCSSPEIMKVLKTKKVSKNKSIDRKNIGLEKIERVSPEEMLSLFYDTPEIVTRSEKKEETVKKINQINPVDYTIVIDWMVEGKRRVKLKNNKTGQVFIATEGNNDGNVTLLYRDYFKYRFRIDGVDVEIKR